MNTRYEYKYWLTFDQYRDIKQKIQFAFEPDKNSARGPYPVLSRYFDTNDLYFYQQKIDGQLLHIKIRLRQYTKQWKEDESFFCEAKIKYDDHQRKIRKAISTPRREFVHSGEFQNFYLPFSQGKELIETSQVLYHREAYHNFDKSLRMTFDHDITAASIKQGEYSGLVLMEIKTKSSEVPKVIWKWLRDRKVKLSRFSKYADSFQKMHESKASLLR